MEEALERTIRRALADAQAAGEDYLGQTELAVRTVRQARPDMTAHEALTAVELGAEVEDGMMARVLALFLSIAWLISADLAVACSCAAPATTETAFRQSSAVFRGTVTDISQPFFDRIGITSSGLYRVRFEVTKSWKSAGSDEFVVKTRLSGEACGYPFETGQDYLVYVAKIMGDIETGICTGTRAIVGPDPEMEELDALVERSDD